VTDAPKFLAFGTSDLRRVNGIDFHQCAHIPGFDQPGRVVRTFRIGNRLVPRWLYELTLDMAMQIEGRARASLEKTAVARAVDGTISVDKRPAAKEE
jgi:hypothetical protein